MTAALRLVEARPLPSWRDGEIVVLGGVMLGASDALDPEDFGDVAHAKLAGLVCRMREEGAPVDLTTVSERVAHSRDPFAFGGVAYVVELADHAPPSLACLPYYLRRLRALRLLRVAALIGSQLDRDAREAEGDVDVLVPTATASVAAALADLGRLVPDARAEIACDLLLAWGFGRDEMMALWAAMRARRGE